MLLSLKSCIFFLMKDKKGVDPDRKGGGEKPKGLERGETGNMTNLVRKIIYFH